MDSVSDWWTLFLCSKDSVGIGDVFAGKVPTSLTNNFFLNFGGPWACVVVHS